MRAGSVISTVVVVFMALGPVEASHGMAFASLARRHMHHHHHRHNETGELVKRTSCTFPTNVGLVSVTPKKKNAGWAMSPDQECKPNMFCPYACPPGQQMAQWDPTATSYVYPKSMNGGLKCDASGKISKPFPNKPYCIKGKGTVLAKNTAKKGVSFCQTVLPGNEAMLIPTGVNAGATVTLDVPGTDYWAGTAAHYYVNAPGIWKEGCIWGTKEKPIGNWAPYVAGANMAADGITYAKIGWNPIYLETSNSFHTKKPSFGIKITCQGNGCNGTPCSIDPRKNGVNQMTGASVTSIGAGGGSSCTVGIRPGSKAVITVFDV